MDLLLLREESAGMCVICSKWAKNMQKRWSDPSQTGTDGAASLTTQRATNI